MEKQLSEKIEKALRKLMDEDHYKINAFQLQEWLIDVKKLETEKINLLNKGDVSGSLPTEAEIEKFARIWGDQWMYSRVAFEGYREGAKWMLRMLFGGNDR